MIRTLGVLDGCPITVDDVGRVTFKADADIDADGSPHAYHPTDRLGLDALCNARDKAGGWCGVVTTNGRPDGLPMIQHANDPAPGFYVSPTSLHLRGPYGEVLAPSNPRRYVDSEIVPFIVIPPLIADAVAGLVLGCQARVTNLRTNQSTLAVVADIGPTRRLGEISIACALAIGVDASARTGGEEDRVIFYELWPGQNAVVNSVAYPLQHFGAAESDPLPASPGAADPSAPAAAAPTPLQPHLRPGDVPADSRSTHD